MFKGPIIRGVYMRHPRAHDKETDLEITEGALTSPILVDIMLSNEGGCSEFPNPNGYHVE